MRGERQILDQLDSWASNQDNVRAMLLTGSRSDPHAVTDLFSDYDIELYVNDPVPFSRNDSWLDAIGQVMIRWPLVPG